MNKNENILILRIWNKMLLAAFNYDIDHEIPIGLVTIGKFDGKNPAMACITNGGRVLIH